MNIAVYGRNFGNSFNGMAIQLFEELKNNGANVFIKDKFNDFLNRKIGYYPQVAGTFTNSLNKDVSFSLMISIGGDGTFLEAATVVGDSGVPILGINTGKMGFLAYVNAANLIWAIKQFFNNEYGIKKRMLLDVTSEELINIDTNFCLNEFSLQKSYSPRMIKIKVYADDDFINTYWSDGIIVSTPTGSTAYSMSNGGPIIHPDSDAIVITPIANHNLTVRPLVLPGSSIIDVIVEASEDKVLASLDYRSFYLNPKTAKNKKITIKRTNFYINFVSLLKNNYFSTLRSKLMWGSDVRN